MNAAERLYKLHQILQARRTPMAARQLAEELGCSRATLFRTLDQLRNEFRAPIENIPRKGYLYLRDSSGFELPGVWFSDEELEGLLIAEQLLESLKETGFEDALAPIRVRLQNLLHRGAFRMQRFPLDRFRFPQTHRRRMAGDQFKLAVTALVERRQLRFAYRARGDGRQSRRTASPQRLVFYQNHWYLDALDEGKQALRTFALDRLSDIKLLNDPATDVDESQLDAELLPSYGIFSGKPSHWARLLFTKERARWVADELWHSDQIGKTLPDGSYELKLPYSDPRELLGEILRHGPHVKALAPVALRQQVAEALAQAHRQYTPAPKNQKK